MTFLVLVISLQQQKLLKKQLITALAIIQLPVGGSACENGFSH